MKLSPSEQIKLEECQKQHANISSKRAVELALEFEDLAKEAGPLDPIYNRLLEKAHFYLEYSALLEKVERHM